MNIINDLGEGVLDLFLLNKSFVQRSQQILALLKQQVHD